MSSTPETQFGARCELPADRRCAPAHAVIAHFRRRLGSIHSDQRGAISILSVFTLLVFTFLLVMIVNVGTHLDDKIRMQNSADAAAHGAGVVLARGMNAISFTNHLLSDVFAMTAYLREGQQRRAENLTRDVLSAWEQVAGVYSNAEFPKFKAVGDALPDKINKERELIQAFGDMTQEIAQFSLPVYESILAEQQIPAFQRNVVLQLPGIAGETAGRTARRNGYSRKELRENPSFDTSTTSSRGVQDAFLWRWKTDPRNPSDETNPLVRTLPAIDPSPMGFDYAFLPEPESYLAEGRVQRRELAKHYLELWTLQNLGAFESDAGLSQFHMLWRVFTCAELERLLNENADRNLPMVMRRGDSGKPVKEMEGDELNKHLDDEFHFALVIYRKHPDEAGPGIFRNPLSKQQDAVAFAELELYVGQSRWWRYIPNQNPPPQLNSPFGQGTLGGSMAQSNNNNPQPGWVPENWPHHWDLLNQNWMSRLVPATAEMLPQILKEVPRLPNKFRPPKFDNTSIQDFRQLNTH